MRIANDYVQKSQVLEILQKAGISEDVQKKIKNLPHPQEMRFDVSREHNGGIILTMVPSGTDRYGKTLFEGELKTEIQGSHLLQTYRRFYDEDRYTAVKYFLSTEIPVSQIVGLEVKNKVLLTEQMDFSEYISLKYLKNGDLLKTVQKPYSSVETDSCLKFDVSREHNGGLELIFYKRECEDVSYDAVLSEKVPGTVLDNHWKDRCNQKSFWDTGIPAEQISSFTFADRITAGEDVSFLFAKCCSLEYLDLKQLNTSQTRNMHRMLSDCYCLKSLCTEGMDVRKVEDSSYLFNDCISIRKINLPDWKMPSLISMEGMFERCLSLESLDLSGLEAEKAENISYLCNGCENLRKLDVQGIHVKNAEKTTDMVAGCVLLERPDISVLRTEQNQNQEEREME